MRQIGVSRTGYWRMRDGSETADVKVTGRGLLFTLGAPEPSRWLFTVTADTQLSPISCSPGTFGRISGHGCLPLSYSTVSVGKGTCALLQGLCCLLLSQGRQPLPRKDLGRKVLFTSCHFFIAGLFYRPYLYISGRCSHCLQYPCWARSALSIW